MRKLFVIACAFILISLPARSAYSSVWFQVEDTVGQEKNYIDLQSIERITPFVKFLAKNIDRKGEAIKTNYIVNCSTRSGAIRDVSIYDSNDLFVKSYSFKDDNLQWGNVTPRSIMHIFWNVVCRETISK